MNLSPYKMCSEKKKKQMCSESPSSLPSQAQTLKVSQLSSTLRIHITHTHSSPKASTDALEMSSSCT